MFWEINKYYSWEDATIEILIMLVFSFALWFLLSYLIFYKKSFKIKKDNKKKKINLDKYNLDNFKIISWLWWKAEKILNKNNIYTFEDLSEQKVNNLIKILEKQWKINKALYVKTWPDQARLAFKKRWWELKEYQELLLKSKKSKKRSK